VIVRGGEPLKSIAAADARPPYADAADAKTGERALSRSARSQTQPTFSFLDHRPPHASKH
jgi:hypothetical protein